MKIKELFKKIFQSECIDESANKKQKNKTQDNKSRNISKLTAPGKEYYRGLVVEFCHRCYKVNNAAIFVTNGRKLDPSKTLEEYKEYIGSDIVMQALEFCVDRFNRMNDNGNPEDFDKGEVVATWIDPSFMTPEEQAQHLLNITDDMVIESLSPREAYECALICNMSGKNEQSMVLLEYAAKSDDCFAMYQMAMIASSSNDYETARNWFLKAAEKGMDIAQYAVGNFYYYGQGVDVDYSEAIRWYRLAAKQGQPQAQCNLGACYYNGQGVDVDYKEAFNWYFKSAESGEPHALYNLGTCYMNGQGTEKDMRKALDYFELAAEKGHPGAEAKVSLFAAMLKEKSLKKN